MAKGSHYEAGIPGIFAVGLASKPVTGATTDQWVAV